MHQVAAAPISWGVSEVPGWGRVLPPSTVFGAMRSLGLGATELGPPGYLEPDAATIRETLGTYGLSLVGGFLAAPLHEADAVTNATRTAQLLAAAGGDVLVLCAAAGHPGYDERPALTGEQWRSLIGNLNRIARAAQQHGVHAVLHPHVGSYVESDAEVRRFLTDSSLGLCLDTGHLLVGGADPVAIAEEFADRVAHVHLKDVDGALATKVREGSLTFTAAVRAGLFVPLGTGSVDTAAMLRAVRSAGYAGWYVLEQDTALGNDSADERPADDTATSLAYLRTLLEA